MNIMLIQYAGSSFCSIAKQFLSHLRSRTLHSDKLEQIGYMFWPNIMQKPESHITLEEQAL